MLHDPAILHLGGAIILTDDAVYLHGVASNRLGLHGIIAVGAICIIGAVNGQNITLGILDLHVAVLSVVNLSDFTGHIVLALGVGVVLLGGAQCQSVNDAQLAVCLGIGGNIGCSRHGTGKFYSLAVGAIGDGCDKSILSLGFLGNQNQLAVLNLGSCSTFGNSPCDSKLGVSHIETIDQFDAIVNRTGIVGLQLVNTLFQRGNAGYFLQSIELVIEAVILGCDRTYSSIISVISGAEPVVLVTHNSNQSLAVSIICIYGGCGLFKCAIDMLAIDNHIDVLLRTIYIGIQIVATRSSFQVYIRSTFNGLSSSQIIGAHSTGDEEQLVIDIGLNHTELISNICFGSGCQQFRD